MSGQLDFFRLPTTRDEWESEYPDYQPRFLAWLYAIGSSPASRPPLYEFVAWIGVRLAEYRAERRMAREEPLAGRQDDFTDWLWARTPTPSQEKERPAG